MFKRDPNGEAVRTAGELYENREYVAAYESFKPAYDKVVADMQRVLARNIEFAANELAQKLRKPLAAAKENVQNMQGARTAGDRPIRKATARPGSQAARPALHKKRRKGRGCRTPRQKKHRPPRSTAPMKRDWAPATPASLEIVSGDKRYKKAHYAPPERGTVYLVRDKAKGERIIRVISTSPDGTHVKSNSRKWNAAE